MLKNRRKNTALKNTATEGPGSLCLRCRMILWSSVVVMGGKEVSRMSMLEWGSGLRESELAVMLFVTSSIFSWSKSTPFWSFWKILDQGERKSTSLSDVSWILLLSWFLMHRRTYLWFTWILSTDLKIMRGVQDSLILCFVQFSFKCVSEVHTRRQSCSEYLWECLCIIL